MIGVELKKAVLMPNQKPILFENKFYHVDVPGMQRESERETTTSPIVELNMKTNQCQYQCHNQISVNRLLQ